MPTDVHQRYKKQENVNKKMLLLGHHNSSINKSKETEIAEIPDKDFKRIMLEFCPLPCEEHAIR